MSASEKTLLTVDVAIIGGGMAGACLALLLAKHCPQLEVALLEQRPLPQADAALDLPSFDTRATAISAGSLKVFRDLGLWSMLKEYAAPIHQVHVSDRGHSLGAGLSAERESEAAFEDMLGAVIENAALGPLLYRALATTDTCVLAPARVTGVKMHQGGAELSWRGTEHNAGSTAEQTLNTRLLVVADGVNSPLCQQLGIATDEEAYHQHALVTTVELQRNHRGVAYERFTDNGPMALLPLPRRDGSHRAALVWTCASDEAEAIAGLPEAAFIDRLQKVFGWRAGRILRSGSVQHYPLKLSLAREQVRRGLVLVGNCAHFLHPVAGQGFNLTLRDCETLARTIARHGGSSAQTAPGELDLLQTYWRERQHDQQLTIGFSDRIPPLFAARNLFAAGLRQAGLLGLALAPPLRGAFARQAAGLAV
ncbi:FAD-dependent monooxygenase [Microbulbifer sp.]|uniref:FAD-dependent monooxygenase n=1 Tax=Microbulbifer sp. TaxID=1908541 RepID=UPI002583AFDE|nr:FAD-dependent monooxygenase [Microbulbifer sp.]